MEIISEDYFNTMKGRILSSAANETSVKAYILMTSCIIHAICWCSYRQYHSGSTQGLLDCLLKAASSMISPGFIKAHYRGSQKDSSQYHFVGMLLPQPFYPDLVEAPCILRGM